jgi:hypothetical protein
MMDRLQRGILEQRHHTREVSQNQLFVIPDVSLSDDPLARKLDRGIQIHEVA